MKEVVSDKGKRCTLKEGTSIMSLSVSSGDTDIASRSSEMMSIGAMDSLAMRSRRLVPVTINDSSFSASFLLSASEEDAGAGCAKTGA
jgi:hypothetical protein